MFTISNFSRQDNPPTAPDTWTAIALQTTAVQTAAGHTTALQTAIPPPIGPLPLPARIWSAIVLAAHVTADSVLVVPRRAGDRLFTMNDNEAYWRGWQIVKLHCGLARRYRDPDFDELAASTGESGTTGESGATVIWR